MSKLFTIFAFLFTISITAHAKKISGEAVVSIAEDIKTKRSEMIYSIIESKTGKSQRLKFQQGAFPVWFQTGKKIDVDVSETAKSTDAAEVYSITQVAASFQTPYVTAIRKVLLMRLNFPEGPAYLDRATILSRMYDPVNSVASFYLQSTRGKITFSGDANGDGQPDILDVNLTVNVSDNCDYNSWAQLADADAAKQGFSISQYQHLVYVLPSQTVKCYWSGLGNVPGSRVWLRYGNSFAHELTHNIGLHHASNDFNNDGVFDSEYGDGSSMPNGTNFNSVYTERLGILSAWPNQIVTGSAGQFQLTALGQDPNTALFPQIIKIKKGNTGANYYLSLRTAAGLDSPIGAEYVGVSVHTSNGRSLWIKTLKPGEVFQDVTNGIEITALSYSSDGQSIGIDIKAICNLGTSELNLSSSQIFVNAQGTATVGWALKNNDGVYCPATTYNLSASAPSGVSINSQSSISVPAGITASGIISLQAAASLGSFNLSFTAVDQSAKHGSLSKSVAVAFDLIAPDVPRSVSVTYRKSVATLSWTASSDSGSGLAEYRIYRNGELVGSTSATTYSEYGLLAGSYSYTVVAVDNAGNLSAASVPALLTVKASTKGRR